MKKKVVVVSALYPSRVRAVDQYRWVGFTGGCLVFLHAFSAVFSEWQVAALFFFSSEPADSCCQFLFSSKKKRKKFDWRDIRFWSLVRLNTTFERSGHPPKANDVPSTILGKKGTVSVKLHVHAVFFALTP